MWIFDYEEDRHPLTLELFKDQLYVYSTNFQTYVFKKIVKNIQNINTGFITLYKTYTPICISEFQVFRFLDCMYLQNSVLENYSVIKPSHISTVKHMIVHIR